MYIRSASGNGGTTGAGAGLSAPPVGGRGLACHCLDGGLSAGTSL